MKSIIEKIQPLKEEYNKALSIMQALTLNDFVYDQEDNLWYDRHPNRDKGMLRVGVSGEYCDGSFRAVVFNGGYDHKILETRCAEELEKLIKSFDNGK